MRHVRWDAGTSVLFGLALVAAGVARPLAGGEAAPPQETYDDADRPAVHEEKNGDYAFQIQHPWNYDKPQNARRLYPLVVYLHGGGAARPVKSLPCFGFGNDDPAAVAMQKRHPCFVCAPWSKRSWADPETMKNVSDCVEHLKRAYRIDPDRIYLIGFSMGGSGTYSIADYYYRNYHRPFAGVIRLAGQSRYPDSVHESLSKSSVWLHIGLKDSPERVDRAREAYAKLKAIHVKAVESNNRVEIRVGGKVFEGQTLTLTKDGREIVKKTEYAGMDHGGVSSIPFRDDALLTWLFAQRLP